MTRPNLPVSAFPMPNPSGQINPRELLHKDFERGKLLIAQMLQSKAKYVAQERVLNALCNAIFRGTHLLLEGVRGGGKTAIAEALAEAFNLKVFYMQFMSGLKIEDMLYSWDTNAQQLLGSQLYNAGMELSKIQEIQWTREHLILGEVLAAFDYSAQDSCQMPPILIGDEIDKLDEYGEDFLLQVFGRGFANVPRLRPSNIIGIPPQARQHKKFVYPIVILTSNAMRGGVSSPVKSRGRYTSIAPPTAGERVKILHSKVPAAGADLLLDVCKMIGGLEGKALKERPALREYIEFLETCVDKGIKRVTRETILNNLDCLAKDGNDIITLETAAEAIFEDYIRPPDEKVESLVRQALAETQEAHRAVKAFSQPFKSVA
jgi:hypothetical protein